MASRNPSIRVLVADDQEIVRAGLRNLLGGRTDLRVVDEASTGRELVQLTRRLRPDVGVLGIEMPGAGPDLVARLHAHCPGSRVVVLTMRDDPARARAALRAGALGCLVTTAGAQELTSAIRAVHRGRSFIDARVEADEGVPRPRRPRGRRGSAGSGLSPREGEVLALLARGLTNRQIGQRIGVGVKTVETYRLRLSKKLRLVDRAELVAYALESGLLHPVQLRTREPRNV